MFKNDVVPPQEYPHSQHPRRILSTVKPIIEPSELKSLAIIYQTIEFNLNINHRVAAFGCVRKPRGLGSAGVRLADSRRPLTAAGLCGARHVLGIR